MSEVEEDLPPEHGPWQNATRHVRALIVVARDRPEIWDHFRLLFARDADVEVAYDQRQGERRSRVQPFTPERRQQERRRLAPESDLAARQYLIVRRRWRDDALRLSAVRVDDAEAC
jgi:hypothetical protein